MAFTTGTDFTVPGSGFTTGTDFSFSYGFTGSPGQGVIAITGLTPALVEGFISEPNILPINITGLVLSGSFYIPFIKQAGQGVIAITGLQPAITFGQVINVDIGNIDIIGLLPTAPMGQFIEKARLGEIHLTGLLPILTHGIAAKVSQGLIAIIGDTPNLVIRSVDEPPPGWTSITYTFILIDPAVPGGFVELPISSFQSRQRLDGLSYVSVVINGADNYADEIALGTNQKMQVFRNYNYPDGSQFSQVIAAADYDSLLTAGGGRSGETATLSGTGNYVPAYPQTVELNNPTFRGTALQCRRYRCEIDQRLRPGDTAVINGESFLVNEIVYIVDTQTSIMEVQE